jgi:hypothetical protein
MTNVFKTEYSGLHTTREHGTDLDGSRATYTSTIYAIVNTPMLSNDMVHHLLHVLWDRHVDENSLSLAVRIRRQFLGLPRCCLRILQVSVCDDNDTCTSLSEGECGLLANAASALGLRSLLVSSQAAMLPGCGFVALFTHTDHEAHAI